MLALVGSGEYLPAMETVDTELTRRLPEPPRVVCLPTAAGTEGPERLAYWSDLGIRHFRRLGAQVESVPVIDRASANDPGLARAVAASNFVYLSGGNPNYLYDTLQGSVVWGAILSVIEAGGVLAGCSAGAMVMGESILGFPKRRPGFNLLPKAAIIPHFDEIPSPILILVRLLIGRNQIVIGIEGNTALVYHDAQYAVLGNGGVTIWNKGRSRRYLHGPVPTDALQGVE